jgi:hypothetical protein
MKLSPKTIERLGYYVYLYINPIDKSIFYVGKGKGNRVFAHLNDATESRKVNTIKTIRAHGKEPKIEILVHDLQDEKAALRIETAAIDLLGIDNLTNQVRGWKSGTVGRMGIKQLTALYDGEPATIEEDVILIRINRLYHFGISDSELYEATRGVWKLGDRRNKAELAFAVYMGIVREVYRIRKWSPAGTTKYHTRTDTKIKGRWEFVGSVAENAIRNKYIDKSVSKYFPANSQNPIRYVKC